MVLRDELHGLQEFGVPLPDILRGGVEHVADEPVGNVYVGITVRLGGVLLEDGRNADVEKTLRSAQDDIVVILSEAKNLSVAKYLCKETNYLIKFV